jgi:formate dehydrogenase alpha subunit
MISVSWDEAIEFTANRLLEIKTKDGPQSVALLGSSKCTNEENYLFQKIARVLLKTNNVDNGGYLSGRSVMSLLNEKTGGGCRVNPLAFLENAHVIFVLGADPNQSVPVVSYFIKRATRKGIPLIVADPRKTELTNFATVWFRLLPNSDSHLINALAALLIKKNGHNSTFIDRFTKGFSEYRDSLFSLDLEKVSRVTGITVASMDHAANLLKGKEIAFVVGHGIFQQRYGIESMETIFNLSLMTGSLGREGVGLYLVTRENNEVGAWDMGTVPDMLPGRQPLNSASARKQWEHLWQTRISPDQGLNIVRMIEEAEKGNLKALYIMGENPLRSLPQPERVKKALERLEFLVVQDILETETTRIADVVLPGAAFSEKSGSFTNMEGRIQTFRSAVSPPGNARPDWEILDLLAAKMGYPRRYGSLERLRSEIAQFIHLYGDLKGDSDVAWIKETGQKSLFHPDGKGDLIPFSSVVSREEEVFDKEYPFTAIFGSLRYHLGSGTRTSHSDRIRDFTLKGEIEISPEDGEKLNVHDADLVRVFSRLGSVEREIKWVKGVMPGTIFIPVAFNGNDATRLIGLASLGEPGSPGLKHCPVSLERV